MSALRCREHGTPLRLSDALVVRCPDCEADRRRRRERAARDEHEADVLAALREAQGPSVHDGRPA